MIYDVIESVGKMNSHYSLQIILIIEDVKMHLTAEAIYLMAESNALMFLLLSIIRGTEKSDMNMKTLLIEKEEICFRHMKKIAE